jgi:palmitoyltransferase
MMAAISSSETVTLPPSKTIQRSNGALQRVNEQTIEERIFQFALITIECHFTQKPPIGRKVAQNARDTIKKIMDKTLQQPVVREVLAKNVDIWLRIKAPFVAAIPTLATRSVREAYAETVQPGAHIPESSTLIADNHASLLEDLTVLNNLLVIARNMLAIKEVAQDICAATQLDRQVTKLMVVCINVTSKGYEAENVDGTTRRNLNEVTELYKKLLVTCLQFLHNLTMGNDRLKMRFWFEMLFDNDLHNEPTADLIPPLKVDLVYEEVRNWLRRNNQRCVLAEALLSKHQADVDLGNTAGPLPPDDLLGPTRYEYDEHRGEINGATQTNGLPQTIPVWDEKAVSKEEQDRLYGRVSHEIDVWWKRARDVNYENWVVPMETVEGALCRHEACKANAMTRYIPRVEQGEDPNYEHEDEYDEGPEDEPYEEGDDVQSLVAETGEPEEEEEDEEEEDDDSYVDGPLRGLLTEIPNILDTKQIEALHMTIKACIVDAMGSGLTKAGENLQKTRCKMFLALDCGKNLLREMLVFIAVWEQAETQFIFQITAQIIESFHHNALLPYAWTSLKILKDIVSPAQTVLLRLINYMFRARKNTTIYDDPKDYNRDAKLIHFLYNYFRCRVVPDCIALIYAQAQIRHGKAHPHDFPVDLWDMERAKDGLSQYLDFISVIVDIPQMKPLLIEWDITFELLTLLKELEDGVEKKPLMPDLPLRQTTPATGPQPYHNHPVVSGTPQASVGTQTNQWPDQGNLQPQQPNLPPLHDTPHKFPWSGIKVQILIILTSLVAPSQPGRGPPGPGTKAVQKQIMNYNGILTLLNCCVYDGHNEYLKERATLCLKWVMDGNTEAQQFVRELTPLKNQNPNPDQDEEHLSSPPESVDGGEGGIYDSADRAVEDITDGVDTVTI